MIKVVCSVQGLLVALDLHPRPFRRVWLFTKDSRAAVTELVSPIYDACQILGVKELIAMESMKPVDMRVEGYTEGEPIIVENRHYHYDPFNLDYRFGEWLDSLQWSLPVSSSIIVLGESQYARPQSTP